MPALPSSAARIPPAAPAPTMTTSVFSVAMIHVLLSALGLRLQADDGQPCERLRARHVGTRELQLRAREADEAPAGEVLVAAVDRVGKHAFHGVRAQRVEKRLLRGPSEAGGLALYECGDNLVLPCHWKPAERLLMGLAAIGIERGKPAPVEILQVGVGPRQRVVDVVGYVGIARARLARRAGHEPLGKRPDGGGILVVEERAVARRSRMGVRGCRTGRRRLLGLALAVSLGQQAGAGDRSGSDRCANQ